MISIAVPTGALLDESLDLLRRARVVDLSREELGRKLMVVQGDVRLVLIRPTDVAAYVDYGAVDLGIVGKDTIWETRGGYYELLELGFGGCDLIMAVPESSALRGPESWPPSLRVASKYPRATLSYMRGLGQTVEVVALHGSVELAPLVGLTDAIVDLTATGRTLRENRLRVIATIGRSTARLIGNQVSLKTRFAEVRDVVAGIREATR